ncbi:MAG: hypothetical protein A2925_02425 [Candidatus Yanofskybacteria bacterium RIFCSPLOWO2_01_FULL_44_22]|uniref:Uncharacterized protein n=1 Tax=Candidatus Yanofskybacteria bacterium RIFCSPLOWO2_01_FULL_44_22 TaxID=1802697 RepID=A0A1F8GKL4_9BACT|nr:MAG: hypothetical protein A2925_02425 [Candidatus Yanofskybacteria bacterium RIFCSPLOWO2_01_FULL_44_22]
MEDTKCKSCGRPGKGYKCPDCDSVSEKHDPEHECGGDRCMPKCSGCEDAEENCICPPQEDK